MATHSSTLAWKIPWTEEPGRLQSMGVTKSRARLSDFTFTFHFHALEKEMPTTPVFLPGESQGQGSLVGCHLWGHTESDTTEATLQQQQQQHSPKTKRQDHAAKQVAKNSAAAANLRGVFRGCNH